jgi:hypothetical protein
MKPVQQTILHDPENGKIGNCLSAVLASLLHLPITMIPVFSNEETWVRDLNAWLRPYGLAYMMIDDFEAWCDTYGVEGCFHELAGNTNRFADQLHAVVAMDGKEIYDPHPSQAGLTRIDASGIFIALRPWELLA